MKTSNWQGKGINAWLILLQSSVSFYKQRNILIGNTLEKYDGFNMSCIINLAVVVESFIKSMMLKEMDKHNQNDSDFTRQMVHFLKAKIEGSTYSDLIALWSLVHGTKFSTNINNSGDIQKLMSFRNKLVHGNALEIKYNKVTKEVAYQNSLVDFQKYFDKLGLTKSYDRNDVTYMPFLSSSIVDHFFLATFQFLKDYLIIVDNQNVADVFRKIIEETESFYNV